MKKIINWGIIFSITLLLSACSSNTSTSKVADLEKTIESLSSENTQLKEQLEGNGNKQNLAESTSKEPLGLNEEFIYSDESGKEFVSVKIVELSNNQSKFPDFMQNSEDFDTKNMILATIEYKNIGQDEPYGLSRTEFIAFDQEGKAYTQFMQQNGQDNVSKGRSSQTQIYWSVPNAENIKELEIDYLPVINYIITGDSVTFKVPVEH